MELCCAAAKVMTIMPRKASPRAESGERRAPSVDPIRHRVESISIRNGYSRSPSDCLRNSLQHPETYHCSRQHNGLCNSVVYAHVHGDKWNSVSA
jgi:hypothetical protein